MTARAPRWLDAILIAAIASDLALAVAAVVTPGTWFAVMHRGVGVDALHRALLARAAGAWAALALVQLATLVGWRRWPGWLLVAAGARLSDVLPDVFYLAAAPARTLSTWGLIGAPLVNLGFALYLVSAYRRAR